MQRLGKNYNGYHGETIDIIATISDIRLIAAKHGWAFEPLPYLQDVPIFALHQTFGDARSETSPQRMYVSAGIHGDEPAGPLAIKQLLSENRWPSGLDLTLIPCLNPAGFQQNRREYPCGLDLNRDYLHPQSKEIQAHTSWLERQAPFDICLCLHEDWESHGFYLYELNPDGMPSRANSMIAAVSEVCPIDHSTVIEGREATGGIIRPALDPRNRPKWPESLWLLQHKTRLSYTLEAPSDFPLEIRVNALLGAVNSALASPLLH